MSILFHYAPHLYSIEFAGDATDETKIVAGLCNFIAVESDPGRRKCICAADAEYGLMKSRKTT